MMHRRTNQERPAGAGSAGLPSSGVDARAGEMFVRAAGSGLLLPDRLAMPRTPSGVEWHVVRGTWRDVYGEDPSWDDVASRLTGYGLGQVLATLGGVSAILNSSAPVEGQRRIIAKLFEFPDRVGRDFQAWWDREKPGGLTDFPLFFTEPQVVAAAKIALLACPPVTQTRAASLQPLGESLLMVGDLLDREDAGDLPSAIGTPEAFSSSFRLTKQEADAFADYLFIDAAAARTQLRDRGVGPDALRVYDPLPLANKPAVSEPAVDR